MEKEIIYQDEIDQKLIKETVVFIKKAEKKFIYKGSIEIGLYVLEKFFNNDLDEINSKNTYKSFNFKALCENKSLSIYPNNLLQMVKVAYQEKNLKNHKVDLDKLSYSHRVKLIKIPDSEIKIKVSLANECIKNKYSVKKFKALVNDKRKKLKPKKDYSPSQIINKKILRMDSLLKIHDDLDYEINKKILFKIHPEKRELLKEKTDEIINNLKDELERFKKLKKDLERVEELNGEITDLLITNPNETKNV